MKKQIKKVDIIEILCFFFIAIIVLLMVLSVFPAEIPDDTANILNDIYHHDRWRDWHPITYYLFIRIVMGIVKTPFCIVIFHSVIFLYVQYRIIEYIRKYSKSIVAVIYTAYSVLLGIAGYEYIVIFYKDTIYSIAILGITINLLFIIVEKDNKRNILELCCWILLASMSRHMGWLPIIVGISLLIIRFFTQEKKKIGICLVISLTISMAIFGEVRNSLINRYKVDTAPDYVTYTMPMYMLGAYSIADYEKDEEIVEIMEKVMPFERWQQCFNEDIFWADNLSRSHAAIGDDILKIDTLNLHKDIIIANAKYFFLHPIDYIYKLFRMNNMVWSIVEPKGGYIWLMQTGGCGLELIKQFPEWTARPGISSKLVYCVLNVYKESELLRALTYRGGLAFSIIGVVIVVLFAKKKTDYVLSLMPIVLLNGMMLLSIPAQDPRFILPEIMVSCLWPIYIGHISKKAHR